MSASVDAAKLYRDVLALGEITDRDHPYTRRVFSPLFLQGRDWLRRRFQDAGLRVRIDAGGNLIGRLEGSEPGALPILIGSHTDTVPGGGRFDGIAGVIAGLEVARALQDAGLRLRRPLEVIDFLGEEPSDYGVSCIGSRAMTGHLGPEMLGRRDPSGESVADAIRRVGGEPEALRPGKPLHPGWHAALELHIEQGRVLESASLDVGIVTSIVGINRYQVEVRGQADHAGTTPMGERRDAAVAAASVILAVRDIATRLAAEEDYFVGTVGRVLVDPNAANVIAAVVRLVLDVRFARAPAADIFEARLQEALARIEAAEQVAIDTEGLQGSEPVAASPLVQESLERACRALDLRFRHMTSGAGHDSMFLAPRGPMGMLFVPCRAGRSHCPEEHAGEQELGRGAQVLCEAVLLLDRSPDSGDG